MLELPKIVEIEPTYTCNLRCRMCHVSFMPEEPRPSLRASVLERLRILRGAHVIIGSGFEPMMNREFAQIIRELIKMDTALEVITNGTLLSNENLSALRDANVRILNFSVDGIQPQTYEHIRRGASFTSTITNILRAREQFAGRDTRFCINSTMMRGNMHEVSQIVDFWDRHEFDLVRFISMVVRETEPELIRESLYPVRQAYYAVLDKAAERLILTGQRLVMHSTWFTKSPIAERFPRNVRGGFVFSDNSLKRFVPRPRQDHQLGTWPGMSFPCRSPWTFARILPNADVQLCYQFTVGNLNEESFEDIWFGKRAEAVRARVMAECSICANCDYYRFCLKSGDIDSDDPASYFAAGLLDQLGTVDFETGQMTRPRDIPQLVESIGRMNIVRLGPKYLLVPQALGPIDFQCVRPQDVAGEL